MPAEAIRRKVAELNVSNRNSLPTEWELMLAAAASQHALVDYEPDLGGRRRADLLVMPNGRNGASCLVEITTISDEHAHNINPYDRVCSEIRRKLRKLKAPSAGWHIQVGAKKLGRYGDAEMRLLLGNGRTEELFDEEFFEFVHAVKRDPSLTRTHEWRGEMLGITLSFNPGQRHASGGHLSYTVVHSLKRNPLARALENKAKQLRQTGHDGPYGVIVCDGGCRVLGSRLSTGGLSFSAHDILSDHFSTNQRLSFVLVLHIETQPPSLFGHQTFCHVLHSLPCLRPNSPQVAIDTLECLKNAVASMPAPVASPSNAVICYDRKRISEWWGFPGASMTWSSKSVRLSSRALLEVLSGRRTPDELFAAFTRGDHVAGNFFDNQRNQGRCITSVRLVPGERDDDEIEFLFGPPDAAATPYRVPMTPTDSSDDTPSIGPEQPS